MRKMKEKERISRLLAYLLRHDQTIERSKEGFVPIEVALSKIRRKFPWIEENHLREILDGDEKGRFEISGKNIRARYGHSVPVELDLPEAEVEILYHGTGEGNLNRIAVEGLLPMGRQMVHLSSTPSQAAEVARRHSRSPVVLEVDVAKAKRLGIRVCKASENVYLADRIPPECIRRISDATK